MNNPEQQLKAGYLELARSHVDDAIRALMAASHIDGEAKITPEEIYRSALIHIRGSYTPDQPADSAADEVSWVMRHVGDLRRVAANALDEALAVTSHDSKGTP